MKGGIITNNKLSRIIAITILMLSLSNCSSDNVSNSLQEENNSLKAELAKMQSEETSENKIQESEDNFVDLKIGDTISTENKEITINNIEFSYDVLPDKLDMIYSHYQADSGHVYIHIDVDVKNLQKQNLPCEEIMDIIADYNNGFTYNAFPVPEDSMTGFTYANIVDIKPLETISVRFLIDCPQEVGESSNPIFLTFKVDGENYKYTIR